MRRSPQSKGCRSPALHARFATARRLRSGRPCWPRLSVTGSRKATSLWRRGANSGANSCGRGSYPGGEVHEGLGQLLNHLPPKTAGALVQAINRCGAQLGLGPDWVRRWIGFTVVADALAQYQPNVFQLKGGAAIELRLRRFDGAVVRPRATRDLDATFRGELDDIEGAVRAALAEPRHGFTFRVETDDR